MTPAPTVPTLLHVFSTFEVGGPQVRFAAMVNHFGREFRHGIFAMDGSYAANARLDAGLDTFYPEVKVTKGETLANVRRFRAALKELRPDALVTYNWGAIEWGMANWPAMVRHIHIADGFGPEEAHRQLPRRALTRRVVLARSTLVFPSRTIEKIAKDIWKLSPRRMRLIPNGIDCTRFEVARPPISAWPPSGPTIGTVAVLRREKNLGRLLDAFRLVRNAMPCRLVIAGDGPERAALEAHAASLSLGEDVTFTGYTAETERIYAGLDLFALSSDTEQMPTSVLEAMAAGLPIVSTHVGDVHAMIAPENKEFLVPLETPALADAIVALLKNPARMRSLGDANHKIALRDFDQAVMFDAYRKLFRGL